MRTSGLILDVYDDLDGSFVRSIWPDAQAIPESVKTASTVSGADRASLPDDLFALVLINGDEKLRKYACVDEGNTALSVLYFLKNAHKLPEEAQQRTAENLKIACGWYDLDVPEELEKIALLGKALALATAVPTIKGTANTIKSNMAATHALEGAGQTVVTPQMRDSVLGKTAHKDVPPDLVVLPTEDMKPSAPQAKAMKPTVDVSNAEPPKMLQEKKATRLAAPSIGRYPLDDYRQVKAASRYFDEYNRHMAPSMRREFAENLVKRANELAISVSKEAQKYGAESFAPEYEIKAAFDARRLELEGNKEALALLDGIERVSRYRMWKEASADAPMPVDAPTAVEMLSEFDRATGLTHFYDRTVPDPYYSIYGFEKSAAPSADWSDVIATEYVTAKDLTRLAKIGAFSVKTTFGEDFQQEFLKDPVGMYKSLPLDQKKMLIRMANSTQPGVERTYY